MKSHIAGLVAGRTRLLAAITHDLRTYPTLRRLRSEFIADDEQRDRAARDIDEMSALVDDKLPFAAAHQGSAAAGVVTDLAAEAACFASLRQETGGPFALAAPQTQPLVIKLSR